ncbi:hypothetical protein GCM10017559_61280 [Streptosporangium longisporum]|uniref:Uncharacterized protein n=1 Tax=Streptosporangium longisporum TaxID=46187 RepID=A0ABP6L3S3_9ACTN
MTHPRGGAAQDRVVAAESKELLTGTSAVCPGSVRTKFIPRSSGFVAQTDRGGAIPGADGLKGHHARTAPPPPKHVPVMLLVELTGIDVARCRITGGSP